MDDLLAEFSKHPEVAGIFLDFDGTLSEIVDVPSDARPYPGVAEQLRRLRAAYALVAIVSGRSAHQLLEWLGTGVEIWGVHGAEVVRDGGVALSERAEPHQDLMRTVLAEARDKVEALSIDGLVVEDKGVMVGLHFRSASDVERARTQLDRIAAELVEKFGLARARGRLAYELRPPAQFSKKLVVSDRARAADLRAALFVGDDRVDLPAFDALDELADEGLLTVRVAVSSTEAPRELIERADVVVDGPRGAVDFLTKLASRAQ